MKLGYECAYFSQPISGSFLALVHAGREYKCLGRLSDQDHPTQTLVWCGNYYAGQAWPCASGSAIEGLPACINKRMAIWDRVPDVIDQETVESLENCQDILLQTIPTPYCELVL